MRAESNCPNTWDLGWCHSDHCRMGGKTTIYIKKFSSVLLFTLPRLHFIMYVISFSFCNQILQHHDTSKFYLVFYRRKFNGKDGQKCLKTDNKCC